MIGYITGKILDISEKEILVLTNGGVGYSVFAAGSLLSKCQKDKNISAEIFTVVRETEISLYGFGDKKEKLLFQKLLNVSGIGPKMAITIVSTPIDHFLSAVENGNVPILTKIPGMGKKTAERLIIELRGKLNFSVKSETKKDNIYFSEATDALTNLGYDKNVVSEILEKAPKNIQNSTENLVKYFLSSNS